MKRMHLFRSLAILFSALAPAAMAQESPGPLKIEITEGVIEPLPIAISPFLTEGPEAQALAAQVVSVIESDLEGSGLLRAISERAFISRITSFDSPVQYADWKAINAQGLVTGEADLSGDQLTVRFRLFDVFADSALGEGLQFSGTAEGWRRIAHKVADAIYSRITGEGGYFDSRVVFVSESGSKADRRKRLAVMDYDGANLTYLTDSSDLVLAPRISDTGDQVLYTSYESGIPRIYVIDTKTLKRRALNDEDAAMSFSPRFAPDGKSVLFSLSSGGNTDLYTMTLPNGAPQRLTSESSIETAPSYAPDGSRIVFESDRSGSQQLYVMPAGGGDAQRISFGPGRYGTPVWSPRGDFIAFTKQSRDRFHIGVMRPDGSEERLLTASFLDEGPSWSPNGRVLMFMRETPGASGNAGLFSVDIRGRNLRKVPTPGPASDPAWSPLLP